MCADDLAPEFSEHLRYINCGLPEDLLGAGVYMSGLFVFSVTSRILRARKDEHEDEEEDDRPERLQFSMLHYI